MRRPLLLAAVSSLCVGGCTQQQSRDVGAFICAIGSMLVTAHGGRIGDYAQSLLLMNFLPVQ
jgi:hypothetical protein